jgi:DNA polymerase III alpha subunit
VRSRLGVRSAYSLLYGVRRPEEIIARAASYGATAVSITDRDNLYGVHAFLEAAAEAKLRPIIGVELQAPTAIATAVGSVFAFVQNRAGFARLCEILSAMKRVSLDGAIGPSTSSAHSATTRGASSSLRRSLHSSQSSRTASPLFTLRSRRILSVRCRPRGS